MKKIFLTFSLLLILSACQSNISSDKDNESTESELTTIENNTSSSEEEPRLSDEDLLPSFFNWQSEQLFLVEPIVDPKAIDERNQLNQTFLSTARPTVMEKTGENPLFYSIEDETLKTGHQILEKTTFGSPEEGAVGTGSEDMVTDVVTHTISDIIFDEGVYTIETDNETYRLTIVSDTELTDQYGNRFKAFDTTFSELFEQFSNFKK